MFPASSINVFNGVSQMAYATLRIGRGTAWTVIAGLVVLAALGDVLTGKAIWFGPVYLFVLCITTWLLGWRLGHGVGIFCMLLTFAINGAALYPYASSAISLDLAMRFFAMSIILSAIAAIRGAYMREWWLARTEPMTGALNRQAFFEFGETICGTSDWRVLLYADLDGFKAINDEHGHGAGDQCLRKFAKAVRSSIRREDIFARMGGDEFIIFMSVKDAAAGSAVAARLHATMNNISTTFAGNIRCSVGALLVPPGHATLDNLVRQADALMYEAKTCGAGLRIGESELSLDVNTKGAARRGRRPTILVDSPTPNFVRERRAQHQY